MPASSSPTKQRDLLEGLSPQERRVMLGKALDHLRQMTLSGHIKLAPGNTVRPVPTPPAQNSTEESPAPVPRANNCT